MTDTLGMLAIAVALILWCLAIGVALVGTYLAFRRFCGLPLKLDAPFELIPVSILKPIKGADPGLRENLEGFFNLDYPQYELIFSIADREDPAREIVESLIAQYPAARARLILGDVNVGPNPKVNNLIRSYERATHDWLLISDSNVRAAPDYLKRLVAHLDPSVGMVSAAVAGHDPEGWGGNLEAVYINTFYARMMAGAEAFVQPCVVGKCMLFRRSTADRFGGIRAMARYLAEDYMAGEAVLELGLRVVIACDPVVQHVGYQTFKAFWARHLRWGRIRKAQSPGTFVMEPFIGSIVSGLIGAWAFHRLLDAPFVFFFFVHMVIWASLDLALIMRLGVPMRPRVIGDWLVREILAFPLWLSIASGNTVNWRGTELRLGEGGVLEDTASARHS